MRTLFNKQVQTARLPSGEVDIEALGKLVVAAYGAFMCDRRRADCSLSQMIEELDTLNQDLEHLADKRTAELRQREQELEAQNLRFDAAINNMSQGLIMFDAEANMVICNQRYMEMYDLSPEVVKPGCSLRDLLIHRRATNTYSGDPDEYIPTLLNALKKGQTFTLLTELADGRSISVINHPMADGGWVATHEDITERREAEKQIAHMATHDVLTDLPNRMLLRERLSEALAGLAQDGQLAVLYVDLDHFKTVNDTLGHSVGDELLQAVADRLRGCAEPTDLVAHVGGDEFAIIQPRLERRSDAAFLAKNICTALKAPYDLSGHVAIVDASVGIALAPSDGSEPDELLKNADLALYRAKADGRGGLRFFEPDMDARMRARRTLELDLRRTLNEGAFELYYQPIVNIESGEVTCLEALLRWNHPERGPIPPSEFVPVAEEMGLIVPLGEWVLRKACSDAANWPSGIAVAVNLSPTQIVGADLMPTVIGALARSGLPAARLEVEITEAVLMQSVKATLATLHNLRELGARISLDDFGTGYSSLSYLRSFPLDKIKVDRCFIGGLPGGDSLAIVRAIVSLAHSLNMTTTAEGVETELQAQQVRALGCTEMQGFHISRPRRLEDISRLFLRQEGARAGAA